VALLGSRLFSKCGGNPWAVAFAEPGAKERHEKFASIAAAVTAIVAWLAPKA
jgi:hypothetical protein